MGILDTLRTKKLALSLGMPSAIARDIKWLTNNVDGKEIRFLNCRPYCLNAVSMTTDQAIAESFTKLRYDDGLDIKEIEFTKSGEIECDYLLPCKGDIENGPIFKAIQMEDKYDIYFFDNNIYFTRSWSGDLLIKADAQTVDEGIRISRIEYDNTLYERDYCLQKALYLLKSHGLDMIVPHPLPHNLPKNIKDIVVFSFNEFGRRGWFASYEDTRTILGNEQYNFPKYDTAVRGG